MTEIALQDAQALAEAACKNMYDADACTRWLGMRIEGKGKPKYYRVVSTVDARSRRSHTARSETLAISAPTRSVLPGK